MTDQTRATALAVYAVDAGSLASGRFAWCRIDVDSGTLAGEGRWPSELVERAAEDLRRGAVALGIEAPLWWPVSIEQRQLGQARAGEGNRAWSSGAGATVTPTAIAQLAWMARELAGRVPQARATIDAARALTQPRRSELLLWEAFVSRRGDRDATAHAADARDAARELVTRIGVVRDGVPLVSDVTPGDTPVLNLGAAALLGAGWQLAADALTAPTLVVRADP